MIQIEGNLVTTKGDANENEDAGLVHYKHVLGTPVFTIPKLGYVASYIQNPPGMYVAISAGAVLLLLVFLPDVFAKDEADDVNHENKNKKIDKNKKEEKRDLKKELKEEPKRHNAERPVSVRSRRK